MKYNRYIYDANSYEDGVLGSYRTGAFDIYLSGEFNEDISTLSPVDKGTFVHEYVHYLQNITTLWGIYAGIIRNNDIIGMRKSYEGLSEIQVPYTFTPIKYQRDFRAYLQCSLGTGQLNRIMHIDTNRSTAIVIEDIKNLTKPTQRVHFLCYNTEGKQEDIVIGATIIKEYMAILCESLITPIQIDHPDVPYNVLGILCEKHYPNVAHDKIKLIYLCYFSLFSLEPGIALLNELKEANLNPSLTGREIFDENIAGDVRYQGQIIPIKTFFNQTVDAYRESWRNVLWNCVPEYIDYVLNAVKMQDKIPPIITILDSPSFDDTLVRKLISWIGVPYVHTLDITHVPQIKGVEMNSCHILMPSMAASMYDYIIGNTFKQYRYICPFSNVCQIGDKICDTHPWDKDNCLFDTAKAIMSLDNKKIIAAVTTNENS